MAKYFIILLLGISLFAANSVRAQTGHVDSDGYHPRAGNLALGFELTDFQSDYGMAFTFTTPYFFKKTMAVRLHGGLSWMEAIPADDGLEPNYEWIRYFPVRLAWVISIGLGNGLNRLYAEAGGIMYLGADDIASDIVIGGYGEFGFELFPSMLSPVSYFIQAGGMGSSGEGSEILGEPSVGNGFMLDVGIRWYPK